MDFAFLAIAFNLKKMCSIMTKRAKNGGNNHKNDQFLHIPQFLPSENRIFWENRQKLVA
jgi:hypothetical protein